MTITLPAGRLQLAERAPKQIAAMYRLQRSIELDETIAHLVEVRAPPRSTDAPAGTG